MKGPGLNGFPGLLLGHAPSTRGLPLLVVKGRPGPGRFSAVGPAAKRADGRLGRLSFFQAGRAAGLSDKRSKLRRAAGRKFSALGRAGRSGFFQTGLAVKGWPSPDGRAGRKNLLAAPLAKEPAGRVGRSVRLVRSRSALNFLGRNSLGRSLPNLFGRNSLGRSATNFLGRKSPRRFSLVEATAKRAGG